MLELLNQLDGFDSRGDVKVGPSMVLHSVCVNECCVMRLGNLCCQLALTHNTCSSYTPGHCTAFILCHHAILSALSKSDTGLYFTVEKHGIPFHSILTWRMVLCTLQYTVDSYCILHFHPQTLAAQTEVLSKINCPRTVAMSSVLHQYTRKY